MRIGFVGLGMMGCGMAQNLMRQHTLVLVEGRARAATEMLIAEGAERTASLPELATRSEVVVLCLPDADAVRRVMDEMGPGLARDMLVIDATTSHPRVTQELAAMLREQGVVFADAPVTGGPPQAEAGTLASLVGCEQADFARVEAVVGNYSSVVRRFGKPGAGHLAKLLNNFVTQGTAVLLAEAYAQARAADLSLPALHDVMAAGAARSGTFEKTVVPSLTGDYNGSRFSLANACKDIGYYLDVVEDQKASPAVAVLSTLTRAVEEGFGDRFVSQLLNPDVWQQVRAGGCR